MAWREDAKITRLRAERLFVGKGTGLEVDAQRMYKRGTFEEFRSAPLLAGKAGGAATGTAGDENIMCIGDSMFEYHILGTQTILGPQLVAAGLDIGMDQTANDGVEITQGILARQKHAFTVGTDGAFYLKVKFTIADVSGTDDCAVGFRKAEAYQANIDDYDEMA